jgi:hypothetical protein
MARHFTHARPTRLETIAHDLAHPATQLNLRLPRLVAAALVDP